jgi:hypothetical protein
MFSRSSVIPILLIAISVASAAEVHAQSTESRWSFDAGVGINPSINGNVNSGAIGTLQGQVAAILPNSYGDVYGTGIELRFGGGWMLNSASELRGTFVFQSADADLVRMGDIGPSSLYGQYSDYQSLSLDFGFRRYVPLQTAGIRLYGEGAIGIGFIDAIDVQLAAPQSNVVFNNTDFYDQTAALTLGLNVGVLFPINNRLDFNAQIGLRRISGLAEVDQLVGTGLDELNNDSARVTFPIVVGVRFRF